MELRDLRVLASIAEVGTFSGAARRMKMTQPALSASVKRLEEELGVILFTRHARGVVFTDHGHFLLERSYAILHDVDEARMSLRHLAREPSGEVTIGLPTTVAVGLGPTLLTRVRSRHPGIRLRIVEAMSGALADMLQMGQLDMAILFDIQPMAGLRSEPLLVEDLHLLVSPNDALAQRRSIAFASVADVSLVMPSMIHSIRRLVEATARSEGIALRVDADIDSLGCIVSLVEAGYAAILPLFQVMSSIRAGRMHALEITRPNLSWTLHLANRRDSVRPQASMAVSSLVVEVSRELVGSGAWPARAYTRTSRHGDRLS